jgi:serine/threonine-protein kinase
MTTAWSNLDLSIPDGPSTSSGAQRDPSPRVDEAMQLVGTVVGARYAVRELVGRGGMANVYRAEHLELQRDVALKVMLPQLRHDVAILRRFYAEARATARVHHPNSVAILDAGRTDEGLPYLVMEYLAGRSLASILDRQPLLPLPRVCHVVCSVLAGLGEAHASGVVHRDLKPENIVLLPLSGGRELVKIVDYGLAQVASDASRVTLGGFAIGTPEYMSPEQCRGAVVDGLADVYSAGVLLFELLTAAFPFYGSTPAHVLLHHVSTPPPDPRCKAPPHRVPAPIAAVTLRALAKRRDERWQSAAEMAQALSASLAACAWGRSCGQVCSTCKHGVAEGLTFCGECGMPMPTCLSRVREPLSASADAFISSIDPITELDLPSVRRSA